MRPRLVLSLVTAISLAAAAPVPAATVELQPVTRQLVYKAARGERNHLHIRATRQGVAGERDAVAYTVGDTVPLEPGRGCRRLEGGRGRAVTCRGVLVFDAILASVRLADRADTARARGDFDSVRIDGGPGHDVLVGGSSDDALVGGGGSDLLSGRAGDDRVISVLGIRERGADELRGGPGSDFLLGSAGGDLIEPGGGADEVHARGGADTIRADDATIEGVRCGSGDDRAATDPFDYPLSCERHGPFSAASPVPLQLFASLLGPGVTVVLGCRSRHAARCAGTVQVERGPKAITEERAFSFSNGRRLRVELSTAGPIEGDSPFPPDLGVRVRAPDVSGALTDARYPLRMMLAGAPFFDARR